jgi:hypothetical protein
MGWLQDFENIVNILDVIKDELGHFEEIIAILLKRSDSDPVQ